MSLISGRATYRTFAKDPLLGAIVAQLPGVANALAADAQAEQELSAPIATDDPTAIVDDIIAAGTIDPAKLDEVVRARNEGARSDARRNVLLEIRGRVTETLQSAAETAGPALLGELDRQLQALCAKARPAVTTLNGITNADQAIAAGKPATAAWSIITELRDTYDQIRTSQNLVMMRLYPNELNTARRIPSDLPDEASDARVANLDDIWPTWRANSIANFESITDPTDPRGTIYADLVTGRRLNDAPWPNYAVPQLCWLIQNAQLWVPTPQMLAQLWEQRRERDAAERTRLAKERHPEHV
ncbi:hypothetical protein [Mycolicibacterium neoaurum]|uniref:hypothetical protein n=1 Tax=Mycolicibacterium neoaurum TaxID=1795 RepID=UPI001F4CC85D|nr:hypothetical protein [Mycolicibacterium neoaurum]